MKGDSMTEQNSLMILMSGSLLILWTTFKWKVPHVIWDNKWFRLYSRMLGSYSIMGLCGVMMLLSTPFEEIKPFLKRKNNDSKQEKNLGKD